MSWRLAPDEFLAFPICETGKELPALNLYPFFAAFADQTEASEVELATEQTALRRAELEVQSERFRNGVPVSGGR